MTASLVVSAPVQAAPPGPKHLAAQAEPVDRHGREVKGVPAKPKRQPAVKLPAPRWPSAGQARVRVPAQGRPAVRAAGLPVSVGRVAGPSGAAVSEVSVEVLDRAAVPQVWRDGIVARVSVPAGGTGGQTAVAVDYGAIRYAHGADWASRLQLWQLPECALTTPEVDRCAGKPLPSRNDPKAGVAVASASTNSLVALAAAPSGPGGDYKATPLSASTKWTSGGSSGGFTWSYPVRVPPAAGGAEPEISLSYSSASVDGRSAATNNQPSWLGEGFDYQSGSIERRYVSCDDDKAGTANNSKDTGDLCWRSDNATMVLNGRSTELIFQAGKGWHARTQDGSRIEKLTGADNGDNDGEHWKVTGTDGTQYFFGLDQLPGQTARTGSAWTVPVYGNHTGEPCRATAFADSDCAQTWRWNLDYVVDVRGNTMSYWYDKETNQYGAEITESKNVPYVRGGSLTRIDYGTWDRGASARSVTPTGQVRFTTADRCLSDCGTHNAQRWPDVPWDQECKATATSCDNFSPTFWSTKRLTKISTRVWDTTKATPAWQDVDSWSFTHSFPNPGDGTNAGLWLSSIVHTGHVGGTASFPPVTFEPTAMPNRVLTKTNTTNNWQRLANIVTETGARIQVTYSLPDCTASDLPSSPQNNTRLCYPVIGPDPADPDKDITEWWHKYVVRQVSETDVQIDGGHQSPTKNTYYTYVGAPAWHYADDDGLSKPKYKTWDQFRGYATVETREGDTAQTLTRTTYLRGMHGDRAAPSGGTRSVMVPASLGSETVYDEDAFAGEIREQTVFNGTESKPVSKTVGVPWQSPPTASRTINGDTATARYVRTRTTYTGTALGADGSRGWRTARNHSTFDDAYGTVVSAQDDGDLAVTGDETCTTTTYNRNPAKNLVTLVQRVTTTALACGVAPTRAEEMLADTRNYYDGAASVTTTPVHGSVTKVEELKDWTPGGGTVWQVAKQAGFDAFGRPTSGTDQRGNVTTTAYTPATGTPKQSVVTNALGWKTTVDTLPYWGSVTRNTDQNGRATDITYDPLGRITQVWANGWSRAEHPDKPSTRYAYAYSAGRSAYPYITTDTLTAAGGYRTHYEIFDALLRPRQVQKAAVGGGRVVSDTLHDSWGRVEATYQPHAEPGNPSGTLWWEPEWSVPAVNRNVHDRANRVVAAILLAGDGVTNLVEKWRTGTAYEGDLIRVTPPAGGTPTTTLTDVRGRTTELRQHTTASGVSGGYDATRYTYNARDQLAAVIDASGNTWTYAYDAKGRKVAANDPDKGLTRYAYNDTDDLVKSTDARGEVLAYGYDSLGRRTGLYDDVVSTATRRASWTYDQLYDGRTVRGQLTETSRYSGGQAYTWQVRNVNSRYQATGVNYVIPAREAGLAGTYTYTYGFSDADGSPTTVTYPAAGDAVTETVTTTYDPDTGLPTSMGTNLPTVSSYVAAQRYSAYGEPTLTTRKTAGGVFVDESLAYDTATRRLTTAQVRPETATGTVSARTYRYDAIGNVTAIADAPQIGAADTQCFDYDALRRLTAAWTPAADCSAAPAVGSLGGPAPYWTQWTFDKSGNRTTEVDRAGSGDTTRTYAVPTPGAGVVRPHAVTAVTTSAPGQAAVTRTYGYDAMGNTVSRPGTTGQQTIAWDAEERAVEIVEGAAKTTMTYDADGTRLIRRDAGGTTLFLPDMEVRKAGAAAPTTVRSYAFAGRTVASRTAGPDGLSWIFSDTQGTQQTAVNAVTQAVTIRRQNPYGTVRGPQAAWPTGKGFVGGDVEPTGLTHLGARLYDPQVGRFLSVDPVIDVADPQQMHGYSYAVNSPVTFADPDGKRPLITDSAAGDSKYLKDNNLNWSRNSSGKWSLESRPRADNDRDNGTPNKGSPGKGGGPKKDKSAMKRIAEEIIKWAPKIGDVLAFCWLPACSGASAGIGVLEAIAHLYLGDVNGALKALGSAALGALFGGVGLKKLDNLNPAGPLAARELKYALSKTAKFTVDQMVSFRGVISRERWLPKKVKRGVDMGVGLIATGAEKLLTAIAVEPAVDSVVDPKPKE